MRDRRITLGAATAAPSSYVCRHPPFGLPASRRQGRRLPSRHLWKKGDSYGWHQLKRKMSANGTQPEAIGIASFSANNKGTCPRLSGSVCLSMFFGLAEISLGKRGDRQCRRDACAPLPGRNRRVSHRKMRHLQAPRRRLQAARDFLAGRGCL